MGDGQVNPRRLLAQRPHQPRQQESRAVIGHGQAKGAPGRRRIKTVRRQQRLDLGQGISQRRRQFQRASGGDQAAALAYQQRVAQQITQAPQRMADRRLAQVQALGSAGDVLLAEQRVEDHQ